MTSRLEVRADMPRYRAQRLRLSRFSFPVGSAPLSSVARFRAASRVPRKDGKARARAARSSMRSRRCLVLVAATGANTRSTGAFVTRTGPCVASNAGAGDLDPSVCCLDGDIGQADGSVRCVNAARGHLDRPRCRADALVRHADARSCVAGRRARLARGVTVVARTRARHEDKRPGNGGRGARRPVRRSVRGWRSVSRRRRCTGGSAARPSALRALDFRKIFPRSGTHAPTSQERALEGRACRPVRCPRRKGKR